jgi:hypothetical protein
MKKGTNSNWKAIGLAAIATVALLFAAQLEVAAQTELQYNVLYECPRSPHNFKVLNCPNDKDCEALGVNKYTPTASYKFELAKSSIIDVLKQGGCKVDGKPLEWGQNIAPPENKPQNKLPQTAEMKPVQAGRFKVGDRVLASTMSMGEDKYFEKCTVIKDYMKTEGYDTYRVRCDSPDGGIGQEANVKVPYIRVWANAAPPPATPDCQFSEPTGTVSKASRPSVELFKRVIYERKVATSNGRKVGITFEAFQLGKSYVNRLTNNGLMHDGAPQGATIYTVKTKYIFCDRYTDSTIRWVMEAQYSCFKDNFGDWVCPSDSLKIIEQVYLPNK